MGGQHADEVLGLLESPRAALRYSEDVTQLDHALQCAALATADGATAALVAAALLHDVGHLLEPDRTSETRRVDERHEDLGARHLRRWFGPEVTAPVALHVAAKRYLVATDPSYQTVLSAASVTSLELQGGAMSHAERISFEARRGWDDAVRVRRWDDAAKDPDARVPGLDAYRDLLAALV